MIDDFTYEALKGCYEVASGISAALFILIIVCVFLTVWLVILLFKLIKERRVYKEVEIEYLNRILELSKKNGRKKK